MAEQVGADKIEYEGVGEENEAYRINRLRICQAFKAYDLVKVDDLCVADYADMLGVMEGDALASKWRNRKKGSGLI